jgi:PAS domain S-box-containing protein
MEVGMPYRLIGRWFALLGRRRRLAFAFLLTLKLVSLVLLAVAIRQSSIAARSRRGAYEAIIARSAVTTGERVRVGRIDARLRRSIAVAAGGFVAVTGLTALTLVGLIVTLGREEAARARAEAELGQTALRYAAINRATPAAIITLTPDGIVDDWNPAAEQIFGWTAAEAHGKSILMVIPERFRERHGAALTAAFASGRLVYPGRAWEMWGLRKDGKEFPAEMHVDLFDIGGQSHCIGVIRDISPRKHLEAQQARLHAELRRSNDELQQFAYVASHDLQEPLRMIDKFIGLLEAKHGARFNDEARRYMDFVRDGAQRTQHLIKDLLEYSRVTTKARPSGPVDLARVVAAVTHDLSERIDGAGGTVQVATPLPTVTGEAFQLNQLFQNLIANALKFHRPGVPPVVTVAGRMETDDPACEGGPPCWHFTVADNGIGIDPDQAPKLFQLFTRLHSREEYEGTGIGLAICKKIVERHGGRIWIESLPGRGTTFHFTLPGEPKG